MCVLPVIVTSLATWPWAALAVCLGAALLIAAVRAATRASSLRAALAMYTPHWPPSVIVVGALLAFLLSIVPSVYDALRGDPRSVFRALIFTNLLCLWLPIVSQRKRGGEPSV